MTYDMLNKLIGFGLDSLVYPRMFPIMNHRYVNPLVTTKVPVFEYKQGVAISMVYFHLNATGLSSIHINTL